MEIKEQSELRKVLSGVELPRMCRVRQIFRRDGIDDVVACVREKLQADTRFRERILPRPKEGGPARHQPSDQPHA